MNPPVKLTPGLPSSNLPGANPSSWPGGYPLSWPGANPVELARRLPVELARVRPRLQDEFGMLADSQPAPDSLVGGSRQGAIERQGRIRPMASHSRGRPRIRVAVALCEDGQLLLVEHCKGDHKYWLLPGGGLEWGEGAREAAFRELLEETGVEAKIGHLLLVSETVAPDGSRHLLHLVFSGSRIGSATVPRLEEERITDVRWVPLEKVAGLTFHPPIGATLAALGMNGLGFKEQDSVFLGNLWVD